MGGPGGADAAAGYLADGVAHVRGVFPAPAVAAAAAAVAHLPGWARRRRGDRNLQRVQPLQSCPALADASWIAALYDSPALDRTTDGIFRGRIEPAPRMSRDPHITGLLVEPLDRWWSTGLHRDYRDLVPGIDLAAWRARAGDWRLFNQVNVPLLADASLWVVPGSHLRGDSADEARLVAERDRYRLLAARDAGAAEAAAAREGLLAALRGCGAVNIDAGPGDLVLYRSDMLHCGVYEPGVRRLTLHDAVYSREWHRYALEVVG